MALPRAACRPRSSPTYFSIAVAAAAAGTKIPGLQTKPGEGFGIKETGLAVVHAGETTGTFDMGETNKLLTTLIANTGTNVVAKETNQLLMRLLVSSDKQVNRLGDIGTA